MLEASLLRPQLLLLRGKPLLSISVHPFSLRCLRVEKRKLFLQARASRFGCLKGPRHLVKLTLQLCFPQLPLLGELIHLIAMHQRGSRETLLGFLQLGAELLCLAVQRCDPRLRLRSRLLALSAFWVLSVLPLRELGKSKSERQRRGEMRQGGEREW
jgi:hypothetical protein